MSNKLALIIFEPGTRPQRWYIFGAQCGAQNKVNTLLSQRKAMLAAIYIYPVYIEYRRKFGVHILKTLVSHQGR